MPPLTEKLQELQAEQTGIDVAKPFTERIYELIAGRSEFVNPNAGKFKSEYSKDDEKVVLGTLFGEVSNRTPDKQQLEAQTILNTARNRAKRRGTTLVDEIKRPNQYQAYESNEYKRFVEGKTEDTDKQKIEAISKIWEDLKRNELKDNIDGYEYYVHLPDGSIRATKEFVGVPK
jgi:hypothetical protein